jgi:hypothetical protein
MPGDEIVSVGDVGTEMYFIRFESYYSAFEKE